MSENPEEENERKRHDDIIKKAFEYPEMIRGFFDQHLPKEVKRVIKLDTIKVTKETFIEERLRKKACDILFEAEFADGRNGYLYLIIEAQSSNDSLMAFRLLKYMIEICARHIKEQGEKGGLPMIYPMIFWQSDGKYTAKLNIWDLFPYPEIARSAWVDDCKLINVCKIPDKVLIHNAWTGLFQLVTKYAHKPQLLLQRLDEYGDVLKELDRKSLGQTFNFNIVCYVLTLIDKSDIIKLKEVLDKHINKGEQIMGNVAQEYIDKGRAEGINIGIDKGRAEGINIGIDKGKREIAKNLLQLGLKQEDVSKATGLTQQEIELLSKEI